MTIDPARGVERPVVGSYPDYAQAQRAVDYLSDNKFPVERTAIIGSDLKMVETVTGRLTWGRAAAAGAGSGAWFGLLVGVLLSVFADRSTSFLGFVAAGLLYGIVFGAVFGLVAYALSGGRRDFTSRSKIVASSYDVVADAEVAEDARNLLIKLGWRTG